MYQLKKLLFISTLNFVFFAYGNFNRSLFYRTSSFWEEPRFEKRLLTTLNISLLGGSTYLGRNKYSKKVNVLSIYGPEYLSCLRSSPITTSNVDKICFRGTFDVFEADFNFYQNICYGLYWHFHLPVVLAQLYPSGYDEWNTKPTSQKYALRWQKTVQIFEDFFNKCNLYVTSLRKAALSDSSLFIGWTGSYDKNCYLDFIDISLQAGILFPTGKKKNERLLFDIPYGYNGHWGCTFISDLAWGTCDWLTVGLHADVTAFASRTASIRMKTKYHTALLHSQHDNAHITSGPVWRIGWYGKADHFCLGTSLLFGFAYEQKNRNIVYPCSTKQFKFAIVNSDNHLKAWSRWTFHLLFEWDLTQETSFLGPRIAFFYNHEITGTRVFSTHTIGGALGCDIIWCF